MCLRSTSRRGSAYLIVLGAAALVTVVGVSAAVATRLRGQAARLTDQTTAAGVAAQAALDYAMHRLASDPAWRGTFSHDAWTPDVPFAGGWIAFKLADAADADLANDPGQPVLLTGRGRMGGAARLYQVRLQPVLLRSGQNLLANADFETGDAPWFASDGAIEFRTDLPYSGQGYLRAKWRFMTWAGPAQTLTVPVENGARYRVEFWARARVGAVDVKPALVITASGSGTQWFTGSAYYVGTTWTRYTGTIAPTWTGTLESARFHIVSHTALGDFDVDRVWLMQQSTPVMRAVVGTLKQVVE